MKLKSIILGALVLIAIFGAIAYNNNKNERKRREAAIARAVDVLPPGVEEQWFRYVDDRLKFLIRINGTQIQIRNELFSWENKVSVVSSNMPYAIECNTFTGGSVEFGFGENSIRIPVFGLLSDSIRDSPQAPDIGVSTSSVAAKNLYQKSCDKIAVYMSEIIQP